MEKIKNFFSKIFWKREKNRNKVLFKPKKTLFKRRKYINIKVDIKKYQRFLKKNYIPYYLIFWITFLILIFFIILWPIFRIEEVKIYKKDSVSNINIAYKSIEDFRWYSIFKVDKNLILEKLRNYQENIKDVDLSKKFPKTIDLQIESFKEKFNVSINSKNYILLENWSLIPTINPNKELKNLEIIKNIDKTKILDYKIFFNMDSILKIEELEKKVKENISSVKITWLKYYEKEKELHIMLNNFTRLIFSLDDSISIEEQIKNLAVLDREKSQISNNDKVYIDLRIKWKIYYCSIEDDKNWLKQKQCLSNLEYIYTKL